MPLNHIKSEGTMLKKLLLAALVITGAFSAIAVELPQSDNTLLLAQGYGREQVITAYYYSGGQWVRIKLKSNGNSITFYSTGKDYVGNENWNAVLPNAPIRQVNSGLDGSDIAREFDYTATLTINTGYQMQSLKVYW